MNFVSASESSDLKDFSVVSSETLVKYDLLEWDLAGTFIGRMLNGDIDIFRKVL